MMKKVKKLLKILSVCVLFVFGTIVMDEAKDVYFYDIVGSAVYPVKVGVRNVATGWNVKYKNQKFFITNIHVCDIFGEDAQALDVDGEYLNILYKSETSDVCIAEPRISKAGYTFALDLATFSHIGERVQIIGHPSGLDRTIREGNIFSKGFSEFPWLRNPDYPAPYLFISAIGYKGNSGSPIVNRFGNVVGMCFAGKTGSNTELTAVPASIIKEELDKLIKIQFKAKFLK